MFQKEKVILHIYIFVYLHFNPQVSIQERGIQKSMFWKLLN